MKQESCYFLQFSAKLSRNRISKSPLNYFLIEHFSTLKVRVRFKVNLHVIQKDFDYVSEHKRTSVNLFQKAVRFALNYHWKDGTELLINRKRARSGFSYANVCKSVCISLLIWRLFHLHYNITFKRFHYKTFIYLNVSSATIFRYDKAQNNETGINFNRIKSIEIMFGTEVNSIEIYIKNLENLI